MASEGYLGSVTFTIPLILTLLSLWSFYLSLRFKGLKNTLLTIEMIIIGFSAGCGALTVLFGNDFTEFVWNYFDIFSRLYGVTVLMALGVMYVTHGLKLTPIQEIMLIGFGFFVSYLFLVFEPLFAIRHWAFMIMGVGFLLILWYMAYKCFSQNLPAHGIHIVLVSFGFLLVGSLDSFISLPDANKSPWFNEKVISQILQIWGYWAIYITYKALLNIKNKTYL